MKFKAFLLSFLLVGFLAACGGEDEQTSAEKDTDTEKTEEATDVVTTASIVNDADAFVSAVSKEGTWIIATLGDLTIEEEVVVAGEFHDKGDAAEAIYRKIAPYTQDEDHNITESFTITVPKLTVQSENLRIQGGVIKGDVYVEANGFNLHESAKVDGNVYFASEDVKATAAIDGEVTGATEVAAGDADVVTTASIVNDADAFVSAVSEEGTWIIATLGDLTIEEDVVVAGEFHDKGDAANDIYRKIAPYTQDEDHNITESFTITVPKLTVQSENLRFQGGILKGDIVVEANGFNLDKSAKVEGNIYFANEDVKAAAAIDGEVTGEQAVQ
ncbi:polymer-forming cytoskeletal protein [Aquibacillus kalidii]|uniref:polymer-forming cytoskeletal protein n=1 Tax=Aquibacillus kalidii TaxID=2762597 RepID=UPI001F3D80DC|nr:polymer-forming cytoskeletal protein [Aquibacillus kalidii]